MTMSKAIQSIDTAISSAGALRRGAGKCAGQDEAGGFSRLLSAGRSEQAEAQAVPGSGKNVPDEPRQADAGDAREADTGTATAARWQLPVLPRF